MSLLNLASQYAHNLATFGRLMAAVLVIIRTENVLSQFSSARAVEFMIMVNLAALAIRLASVNATTESVKNFMAITKRAIFMRFMRGYTLHQLLKLYPRVDLEWIEGALRKYMGKAQ